MNTSLSTRSANAMYGREAELQKLMEAYQTVKERNRPYFVNILAETGFGKTRLIQKFYAELTVAYDPQHYWETGLGTGPDMPINPLPDIPVSDASDGLPHHTGVGEANTKVAPDIPFIWWGLRNSNEEARNVSQGGDAYQRAQSFLDPQLAAYAHNQQTRHASIDIAKKSATLALKALTFGLSDMVKDMVDMVDPVISILELNDTKHAHRKSDWYIKRVQSVRAKTDAKSRMDIVVDGLLYMMRQQNWSALGVSVYEKQAVPLILVLDDVQFLDFNTMVLAERLLNVAVREGLPLLLLSTAWTHRWDRSNNAGQMPKLRSFFDHIDASEKCQISLDKLEDRYLGPMVSDLLPSLSEQQREILIRRADGNPLIVKELAAYFNSNADFFENGDISQRLTVEGEKKLGEKSPSIHDLVAERYKGLSTSTLQSLQWASFQGIEFDELFTQIALDPTPRDAISRSLLEANTPAHLVTPVFEANWRFTQRSYWEVITAGLEETGKIREVKRAYFANLRKMRHSAEWRSLKRLDQRKLLDLLIGLDQDPAHTDRLPMEEKATILGDKIMLLVQDQLFEESLQIVVQLVNMLPASASEIGWWPITVIPLETNIAILRALSIVGFGVDDSLLASQPTNAIDYKAGFEELGVHLIDVHVSLVVLDDNRSRDAKTLSTDIAAVQAVLAFLGTYGRTSGSMHWVRHHRTLHGLFCALTEAPTLPSLLDYLRVSVDNIKQNVGRLHGLHPDAMLKDGVAVNARMRNAHARNFWSDAQLDMDTAEQVLIRIGNDYPASYTLCKAYFLASKGSCLSAFKSFNPDHDIYNRAWAKAADLYGDLLFDIVSPRAGLEATDNSFLRDLSLQEASLLLNGLKNVIMDAVVYQRDFHTPLFPKAIACAEYFFEQLDRTQMGTLEFVCDALNLGYAVIARVGGMQGGEPEVADALLPDFLSGLNVQAVRVVDDEVGPTLVMKDLVKQQMRLIERFRPLFGTALPFILLEIECNTHLFEVCAGLDIPGPAVPNLIDRAFASIRRSEDDRWAGRAQAPALFRPIAIFLCIALDGAGRVTRLKELLAHYPSAQEYPLLRHQYDNFVENGIM